jgi:hypothetical protein
MIVLSVRCNRDGEKKAMLAKLLPVLVLIIVGGVLSTIGWRILKQWDESNERWNETDQKRPYFGTCLLFIGVLMQVVWIFYYIEQAMCNPGQGFVGLFDPNAGEPCFPD